MRLTITSLVALGIAVAVAWRLGGTLGAGVLMGFLLGAGLSGIGVLYQRHLLATRPERFLLGMVVSFGAKLVALLIGALAFRFIDAAAETADWRSLLISFAAAVCAILPIATIDALRDSGRKRRVDGPPGAAPGEVRL